MVSELRQLRALMDAILKDVPSIWTMECQEPFQRSKDTFVSDLLFTHFDNSKEIVKAVDASEYGIGAVISHRFPDGTEKAIKNASRSLTASEKNCGQVERKSTPSPLMSESFTATTMDGASGCDGSQTTHRCI
ncbi:hypothetical protein ANCDUO_20117 [Ancylostoma duodenale]|uniref:Reverse transcriptase/retrotransposon-derived protein RNase H-like domain-containing protein n=1 Tax=Ancylostoma duodenale TaxID=51022 RepID=A0A0C2CJ37_9BILA|nr:hypothetical protein ANCDUO_20117 [Ancylostoma duodenale]